MKGLPFIGEDGYYPEWARGSGRWLFQRTLIVVGQLLGGIAQMHAAQVPASEQLIVWSPQRRLPLIGSMPNAIHQERQRALRELHSFNLVCYGNDCNAPKPGCGCTNGLEPSQIIRESGVKPEDWLLQCPSCGSSVGPDLGLIITESLISRWVSLGRPSLENPGAAAGIKSAPPVTDLPHWIQDFDPSHLELAYVGQQMWRDISTMLSDMNSSEVS